MDTKEFVTEAREALRGLNNAKTLHVLLSVHRQCKFSCILSYGFDAVESAMQAPTLSHPERRFIQNSIIPGIQRLIRNADSAKTVAHLRCLENLASWSVSRDTRHALAAITSYAFSYTNGPGLHQVNLLNQIHGVRVS